MAEYVSARWGWRLACSLSVQRIATRRSGSLSSIHKSALSPHGALSRGGAPHPRPLAASSAVALASQVVASPSADTDTSDSVAPQVILTREKGKNKKLMQALQSLNISTLELPLICHVDGPDRAKLPETLQAGGFDWVVLTSPEAATVFLRGWREAACPSVRVAAVGGGTAQVVERQGATGAEGTAEAEAHAAHAQGSVGLAVDFVSPRATALDLGAQLPEILGGSGRVLYPASAKASHDLENALSARGFTVTRLNTYSTEPVHSIDAALLLQAAAAPVVTFASPSAVKAWARHLETHADGVVEWEGVAACIGQTSADAARAAGMRNVVHPEDPGIEGWAACVAEALQ